MDYRQEIADLIDERLSSGKPPPRREEIRASLDIGLRALEKRLENAGTTYRELVAERRAALADARRAASLQERRSTTNMRPATVSVDFLRPQARAKVTYLRRPPRLTALEFEIAALICRGATTRAIASSRAISPRTVVGHRYRIYSKLGVHNAAQLVTKILTRSADVEGDVEQLSPRQREVAARLCRGERPRAIAVALGIARGTVAMHRDMIYAKLGVHSAPELAAKMMSPSAANTA